MKKHDPSKTWLGNAWDFTKKMLSRYTDQRSFTFGASLAYYTLFSIAPILTIILATLGSIAGTEAIQGHLSDELGALFGAKTAVRLEGLVANLNQSDAKGLASVISVPMLLVTATAVVNELKATLNQVWNIRENPKNSILSFLRNRFLSLAFIVGLGFVLLVTLVLNSATTALSDNLARMVPGLGEVTITIFSAVISLLLTSLIFYLLFRYLPDARAESRDLMAGAVFTAVLFVVGEYLIGVYIGNSDVISGFGAAGAFAALLLWVYYSSQILIIGAEFTQEWAERSGRPIQPTDNAVFLLIKEKEIDSATDDAEIEGKGKSNKSQYQSNA